MHGNLRKFLDSISKQLNDASLELSRQKRDGERDAVLRCAKAFGGMAMHELDELAKGGA